ncbi:Ff.00g129880.m01.CDS01 [Fusarium sp. VM40]|nr:Ff.00g129880.m01.CDS01 [Fusarium sp. VM40]
MSSQQYPLRQSGIYRNLPQFDPSIKGLSAIICGASGISGFNTLRALLDSPERWSTIYTLSRSPLPPKQLDFIEPSLRSRIKHVSVDLTQSADQVKDSLVQAGVQADYVFFYAYLQPSSSESGMSTSMAQGLYDLNVPMFDNFITGLELANIEPKRILLQTGGKNYGMHIGRVRTPVVESDPQPRHLQTNFYYAQQDRLLKFCDNHPNTKWNMIFPCGIIGTATNAQINTFYGFGAYAAIQAHKKEPLRFGGNFDSWQFGACHSTAILTGFLSEWAVLEETCANQAFNAQDGAGLSWDRFFSELARWYGVEKGVIGPEEEASKFKVTKFAGGKDAPLGYGPPLTLPLTFSLKDWFAETDNKDHWKKLMAASDGQLTYDITEDSPSVFVGDFAYLNFGTPAANKARMFGWNGFVDSLESIFEMFQELAKMGMLPPMEVEKARALV